MLDRPHVRLAVGRPDERDRPRWESVFKLDRWFESIAPPGVIEGCRFDLPPAMKATGRVPLTPEPFSRTFDDAVHAANCAD